MAEDTATVDPANRLVGADGKPARRRESKVCPRCGAGPEKRTASAGFGEPHPVCTKCGHEFLGERM